MCWYITIQDHYCLFHSLLNLNIFVKVLEEWLELMILLANVIWCLLSLSWRIWWHWNFICLFLFFFEFPLVIALYIWFSLFLGSYHIFIEWAMVRLLEFMVWNYLILSLGHSISWLWAPLRHLFFIQNWKCFATLILSFHVSNFILKFNIHVSFFWNNPKIVA